VNYSTYQFNLSYYIYYSLFLHCPKASRTLKRWEMRCPYRGLWCWLYVKRLELVIMLPSPNVHITRWIKSESDQKKKAAQCHFIFYHLTNTNTHEHTQYFYFSVHHKKKLLRESFQFIFLVAQPASPASYLESVISCLYIIYIVGYMINYLCIRLFDPLICDEEFFTFTMTYRNFQSTSRDEK
jgi:hypothetical protein